MNSGTKNVIMVIAGGAAIVASSYFAFNKTPVVQTRMDALTLESKLNEDRVAVPLKKVSQDVRLSNGRPINKSLIIGHTDFNNGKAYIIKTDYSFDGPQFDIRVYDQGDGKPYTFIAVNKKGAFGEELWDSERGEFVLDHFEKKFELTYRFCDTPGHGPYPIWEPTAFRSDPCYGRVK